MERDDFPWGWACAVACAVAVIVMIGGAGGGTTTNSHNNNRTDVRALNDNHVLSDNRVILFSDVQECNAPGACVTTTTTTSTNEVRGNDNTVIASDGTRLCWDASIGTWTSSACQGVQP